MIKILGAVLVLGAGTLYGFVQAVHYARRPKQIRQLHQSLQRLETEIVYGYTPLPEALLSVSKQIKEPLSSMFAELGGSLAGEERTVREVWEGTLRKYWGQSSMKSVEFQAMLQLGHTLGLSDREDQVKHLKLAAAQLHAEEEQAADEQKRFEKMWKSLGLLLGALVVILMY